MSNASTRGEAAAALPLNPREFLILLALAAGKQHGYGILKSVAAESGDSVHLDPANLYRTLRRLEREGWVTERTAPRADGPRRRVYGLTEFGRAVVKAEARRVNRLAVAARARKLIPSSESRP